MSSRSASVARSTNSPRSPSSSSDMHAGYDELGVEAAVAAGMSQQEVELKRKRARDRRSQQAMRDRNKWTVQSLTEQVTLLSHTVDERSRELAMVQARLGLLEGENTQLRTQNAALQLGLTRKDPSGGGGSTVPGAGITTPPDNYILSSQAPTQQMPVSASGARMSAVLWEIPPQNVAPTCLVDQILQGFAVSARTDGFMASTGQERAATYAVKPKVGSLVEPARRTNDDISNFVADIVRSYPEIQGLPKQVAVFWKMSLYLKWIVLLDKESWDLLPPWLRPTPSQLSIPHDAWIDRIPWPGVRDYLIANSTVTLDDWATVYTSSLGFNWLYDPMHVLITTTTDTGAAEIAINPVFEEHLCQLKNWTVDEFFRERFPDLATIIDHDYVSK